MQTNAGTNQNLNSVIWTGNIFVAVGDSGVIPSSLDGVTWKKENSGTTLNLRRVASNSNRIVAVEDGVLTSIIDNPVAVNARFLEKPIPQEV